MYQSLMTHLKSILGDYRRRVSECHCGCPGAGFQKYDPLAVVSEDAQLARWTGFANFDAQLKVCVGVGAQT